MTNQNEVKHTGLPYKQSGSLTEGFSTVLLNEDNEGIAWFPSYLVADEITNKLNSHYELLEACKDLMAELQNMGNYDTQCIMSMNKAEQAITKAEGK